MNALSSSIYSTLTQGTALTALLAGSVSVYKDIAPDNAAYPYVVYNLQGGGEENIMPIRSKDVVYFIRAYSKTSTANAGNIDTQIDALLHGKTLTVSGWNNWWTVREGEIENTEILSNGERVYESGALYRVRLD
jgi:hypothetical protein